jgi:nicotinate phosphoribosyltransferase
VAQELAGEGITVRAVRLDSGDIDGLSRQVREILDMAGLADVAIVASGDLDEHRIAALGASGAPIDSFGVGTQLGTSGDAPSLGAVYKLVEDAGGPRVKLAAGKVTLPGRKQVWRCEGHDVLSLHDEAVPGGRPLLRRVMAAGRRVPEAVEPLHRVRVRAMATIAWLPEPLRSLAPAEEAVWPVDVSPGLTELASRSRARAAAPDPVPPGTA